MGWLELRKFHSTALLTGCALDWMFGDPVHIPHLVRLVGRMITRLELELRRCMRGRELAAGAVPTFIMCAVQWVVPWGLFRLIRSVGFPGFFLSFFHLETLIRYQMMAARGLCTESMKVCRSLEDGGAEMARHHASMIVDRDISVFDKDGIARTAVETVAGNASGGMMAPFLFMALLGPAEGTFYKAANTMDSMIGYKNGTYRSSGHTAALLNDVLSLIPARVMGCLMVSAAFFIPGVDGMDGWRIFLRDEKKHASPNLVHGGTVCVEILHLRLAGDAWYFGSLHKRPFIGEGDRPIVSVDIGGANQLMFAAQGILATVLVAALAVA